MTRGVVVVFAEQLPASGPNPSSGDRKYLWQKGLCVRLSYSPPQTYRRQPMRAIIRTWKQNRVAPGLIMPRVSLQ
jgi:hypothetical protein